MVLIHERGGIFCKNEVSSGLTKQEVLSLAPEIKINDNEIGENGWFKLDHQETPAECFNRAKEIVKVFKELSQGAYKNKTVFAVSHG